MNKETILQEISKLSCFQDLDINIINKIVDETEILSYEIGQPIVNSNGITNKIFFVLDGEARLSTIYQNKEISIAKYGKGSVIGLASMLRVCPSEKLSASSRLSLISLPDKFIIDLYLGQTNFKNWCDNNLFASEALELARSLINKCSRTDIDLKKLFFILLKNIKLTTIEDKKSVELDNQYKYFVASSNIKEYDIFSDFKTKKFLNVRPPFAGRLLSCPLEILSLLDQNNETLNEENINKEETITSNKGPLIPEKTSIDMGQYSPKQKFKLLRGKGPLKETLAMLHMLAMKLELPFRKDTVEKILREELNKGESISLDFCGQILAMLGLQAMKGDIPVEYATRMQTPSIISWKNSLALVIETNSQGVTIASPNDGLVKIDKNDLSEQFPETINSIIVSRTSSTPNEKFGVGWFLPSLKKYKGVLIQVLIASFVVQFFGLANPLLIQVIIDKVISQRSLDTLQVLGIALVFVTILGGIISSLRTFLFTETTNRIDTRLGSEIIDHLIRLPLNYFDKRPVGELGSRVAELEKIRNFLTGQALTTILDAAFSVIYIIVMVLYSWLLTLIALIVVPIQIFITLLGSPLIRRQIKDVAKENAKTQSHLVEVLTGIQTVKAQNVETVSRWKWQEIYNRYISRTFEKTITLTAINQTSTVLQQLSQLLVLWVGASLVLAGKMTLGQLIAFRIISGYVTQPLLRLSSIWQSIQELKVSFERLADIVNTPEESDEADQGNIPLPEIKGNVTFDNVSFNFNVGSPQVLKKVKLNIEQGTFVGVAGQSGSGKSTLMKLLPRLYNANQGRILIDKYDISKVELYSLRRQIGIVPQDPLLFSGTINENIALTNPDISSEEIVRAAKIANAHDFIMDLPKGYSTRVGERGSSLSGGQRQRIAIARTILSKPKLLIMDEATSALDYQTERQVCENLRKSCKGITVFFITHRLSTIKNADTIVMMHDGVISEKGTHHELINKKGRYYALYVQQDSE